MGGISGALGAFGIYETKSSVFGPWAEGPKAQNKLLLSNRLQMRKVHHVATLKFDECQKCHTYQMAVN